MTELHLPNNVQHSHAITSIFLAFAVGWSRRPELTACQMTHC